MYDLGHFGFRLRALDEDHVGAGFRVEAASADRFLQAVGGAGVGAGDEEEVWVAAGFDGGTPSPRAERPRVAARPEPVAAPAAPAPVTHVFEDDAFAEERPAEPERRVAPRIAPRPAVRPDRPERRTVVFDDDDFEDGGGKGSKKTNVLLRNVVKVEDVPDPVAVVEEILARTDVGTVKKLYNVEEYASPLEFLTMVALLTGRLLKVCPFVHPF